MRILVAVVVLVALGFFPALLVVRRPAVALLVAPVSTALVSGTLAIVCVAARTSYGVVVIGTVAASSICAALVVTRFRSLFAVSRRDWWLLAVPALLAVCFTTVHRAPVAYDANVIWWFHARWLAAGGALTADSLSRSVFAFSHPDYPPLGPSVVATFWWASGTRDPAVAQASSAIVTLSAISAFAAATWQVAHTRLRGLAVVVAGGVALATVGMASAIPAAPWTNGYVDVLWAAAFAAAATALLATPSTPASIGLGALTLAAAAMTKNEAMVAAVVLAALAVFRLRDRAPAFRVAPIVALMPAAAWFVTSRALAARSDYAESGRFAELLRLDSQVLHRVRPAVDAVADEVGVVVLIAGAVAGLGVLIARRSYRTLADASPAWWWALWVPITVVTVLGFVVSPDKDVLGQIAVAADRTSLVLNLVLLGSTTTWLVAALTTRWTDRP